MLIKYKTDQIENHRLGIFNLSKKCIVLNNKNTDYKRMVALIAKNDISRLDVLFTNCIKRGKSTRAICETLSRAIDGSYHHKRFSEKSKDIGVLVLKIGGPRLVYVFNKLNLIPSLDIIRRHCQLTNSKEIYFSYSKTLEQIIETRLSQIIKDDNQLHLYRYLYFFVLFDVITLF